MGLNTTVLVLNDALHMIAEDLEFGKNLSDAIQRRRMDEVEYVPAHKKNMSFANAATVIETHHADMKNLVVIGGNTGWNIGPVGFTKATDEEMCRAWAEKLGFRLVKKPSSKTPK